MRELFALFALILTFAPCLQASDNTAPLTIDVSNPNVRITIPGMPEIDMAVHPMNEHKPNLRLRGSTGIITVSIITPPIDAEISPTSCATSVANSILAQDHVSRDNVFLGRANEQTFLIIYGLPLEEAVLLNTHIISASKADQCIEAHVSKISTSESDIDPWFNGFGESNMENL